MSFSIMLDILKEKEKNKILFVQCGAFYLATGEEAVILHKVLNLKCTCFKKNICKVGVPITAMEKYLEKTKYAYVVYDFDKENKRLIKKYNCQRIYLRIMDKHHYIDNKKFYIAMEYTYEIGKIVGGLLKYYAKDNSKSI